MKYKITPTLDRANQLVCPNFNDGKRGDACASAETKPETNADFPLHWAVSITHIISYTSNG